MTTITQTPHLSMTEIGSTSDTNFTNNTTAQTCLQGTTISEIVANLTSSNTQAVTFDQIVLAMVTFGINPSEDNDSYNLIIDALERQKFLIVESLEHEQLRTDENTAAHDLADEVWDILKRSKSSIDEYHHPILTADRERRLIEIYKHGITAKSTSTDEMSYAQKHSIERQIEAGNQALDEIMRCNLRLITKIAFRFSSRIKHLTLDDLIQEGRIGLYKAIEKFDLDSNSRLSTYATWWIRQSIGRAIADNDRTIRLPIHLQETLHRINRERQRWANDHGRDPNTDELARHLRISENNLHLLLRVTQDTMSLDLPVHSGEETTVGDLLPDTMRYEPSRIACQSMMREAIKSAMNQLRERESHILSLRFGLEDDRRLTLEEIGQEYGVTRERIRQIEVKALRKLNKPSIARQLRDFLD